jgi:hypothetical protein
VYLPEPVMAAVSGMECMVNGLSPKLNG